MHVLITGASGFLGRQVSAFLDKKYDGYALMYKHKVPVQGLQQLEGDILRPHRFEEKLKRIDAVIHLAAVNKAITDLEYGRLFETNTVGTFNMLELARKRRARVFIFASSAAVYGDKKVLPLRETFSPNPKSLYGLSKLVGEQTCMYSALKHGFSAICLRISNMYGPGQPLGFVVPDLFDKSTSLNVIQVHNPSSTRDFIYVEDVARAMIRCLDANVSSDVINVGSGKETSAFEVATHLGKFSGKNVVSKIVTNEQVKRSVLDVSKARELLGWKPEMPLGKGLKKTWLHMIARGSL